MTSIEISLVALPIFLVAMAGEAFYYKRFLKRTYGWRVMVSNLVLALTYLAIDALTVGFITSSYIAVHEFRLFAIPTNWLTLVLLVIGVDLSYYWMHRYMHEIRWMWAMHSVHHSAQQITFSVAYRLGWTKPISGAWLFLLPLCWIGFDPLLVATTYLVNQLYQFWLHTETVPKLGWFERYFCTPSHHRVHHATNPEYLDRNYAGIFIFWDKLFGTFAEEKDDVPRTYGLVHQIHTLNPVKIAFAEYGALARDLRSVKTLWEAFGYLLRAPGWRPDGNGMTTEAIRLNALAVNQR